MPEQMHEPQKGMQEHFLASPVDELFAGGEAGGGKSWTVLQDFVYDVDNPHSNGILFRRTYPDLEDLIHKAIEHYAGFNAKYNDSKHSFIFPSGARMRFAHLQFQKDIFTHAGQEYTHIYWDELCHFPRMPYLFLFSRLRSTDMTIKRRIRGTGNPDGEGVLWVKSRFIDKLNPYEIGWFKTLNDRDIRADEKQVQRILKLLDLKAKERTARLKGIDKDLQGFMSRQWMPTVRDENVALMEADPDYESRLDQLPEDKKLAYKYGIWKQFDQPFQLIKTQWLQDALNGEIEHKMGIGAIGADYAETGDMCALCSGRGNRILNFEDYPGMKTPEFARIVYKEHMRYGKYQCHTGVDSVGPGTGVYHDLEELGLGDRIEACRYKNPDFDAKYEKMQIKIHFNNWRSQAWWKLKEDFENRRIDLSALQGDKIDGENVSGYYDNLHLLQEEILCITYQIRNGILHIESKNDLRKEDRLGRSPDRADALCIWNWVRDNNPTPAPKKKVKGLDYSYFDYMKKKNWKDTDYEKQSTDGGWI